MKFKTKSIVVLLFALIFSSSVFAQGNKSENLAKRDHDPYHFGFILSFNQMNFSLKVNESAIGIKPDFLPADYSSYTSAKLLGVTSQPVFGFTVGIVSNLKLAPLLDLRLIPSLAFGERKLNYTISGIEEFPIIEQKSIRSTHVDIPLYVKFKSKRAGNIRAYVLSGIKYTFDLAANSKKNKEAEIDFISLNSQDWLFEAGAGFDFYLPYFKFGVELKMSYGLTDILESQNNFYADGISGLNSKLFQISFTFE